MTAGQPRKQARKVPGRRRMGGREQASSQPEYLAAELGHTIDNEGEPIGLGNPLARNDAELQEFTHQLWRQAQSGRQLRGQFKEMEREGITPDDFWAAGITETLPTTSTTEEVRRYKQKLLFRANVLEAILTETVAELKRIERVKPTDPKPKTD
jgi:hypothetical protein